MGVIWVCYLGFLLVEGFLGEIAVEFGFIVVLGFLFFFGESFAEFFDFGVPHGFEIVEVRLSPFEFELNFPFA